MNIDRRGLRNRLTRALIYAALPSACALLLLPQPLRAQSPAVPPLTRPAPPAAGVQLAAAPVAGQSMAGPPSAPAARSVRPTRYKVGQAGDISLNYVDTDVREIVRLILGEILKVNYSIDPGFQGTVTIQTARPLKRDELIPTLQGLLTQAGGQLTYQNGIYRVSAQGDDANIPPLVANGSMEAGAQVVSLRYASAKQLATILETYAGEGVKVLADPTRNVLILSGSAGARQNVVNLARLFDVDYLAGRSYALYPVKSGDPAKFAADLEAALQLDGDGALTGAVKIVPIEQANAVMVIARQAQYLDRIARLVEQLDKIKLSAGRNIHVYYLKNTQPADIQPLLQRAVNPPSGGNSEEVSPGNLPPTAAPARIGSMTTGSTAPGTPPATGAPPNGATPAAAPPPPAAANTDTGQQNGGGDPRGPQIIADNSNGALIIVATDSEYETIESAIRKLDILPKQVLVEATIAEVTLNRDLQYGVQFYLQNGDGQIAFSNAQVTSTTTIDPASPRSTGTIFQSNFPGLAVSRTFGNVQAALQALKTITDVQVISAPKLLILDRQQASFQVGDLVPTITQSATSVITAGAPVVNNVQYQPTGVILTITPQINSGGLVTLDIEQEVSDVLQTTSSTINSPTFQQRRIKTKVIVQDGDTISLAGLISETKTKGNSGIPYLQEIPILGTLFSTKTNNHDRTELIVLLTPHVMNDQHEAKALTEELRHKLSASSLVP
jgi:general secretion pathway protein D